MAYPSALNTDKFLAGGAMDAPDLQVRTAMNKLAWGMPLTQKEAIRITQRQGLEQQSINTAQEASQKQAVMGLSNVNVGSYAGSMWSAPGSYTAPRAGNEAIADLILKQRYGTFEQGQMRGTINPQGAMAALQAGPNAGAVTTQVPQARPVGIPSAPAINSLLGLEGMENILPQTPTAQGFASPSTQAVPASPQAAPSVQTVGALPQMAQPQLSPALAQILGRSMQQQPSAQVAQPPAGSALAAMTPQMRSLAQSQQSFGLQKDEFDWRKEQAQKQEAIRQEELKLKQSKLAPVRSTPQDALEDAKKLPYDPNTQVPSFTHTEGGFLPTLIAKVPQQFESGSAKLAAERASEGIKRLDDTYTSAVQAETSALQVEKALSSGKVTTGPFAGISSFIKNAAAAAGFDLGATEQQIATKGVKAIQASQVRLLAKGLGSMSNSDREFFLAALPDITDSELANRYFIEIAKANARFAREDRALQRTLEADGKSDAEILRTLEARRESRSISSDVYDRVMSGAAKKSEDKPKSLQDRVAEEQKRRASEKAKAGGK